MITQPLADHLYSSEEKHPYGGIPLRRRTNSGEEQGSYHSPIYFRNPELEQILRINWLTLLWNDNCRIRRRFGFALFTIKSSARYRPASLFPGHERFLASAGFYIQALWFGCTPQFHETCFEESCLPCLCHGGWFFYPLCSAIAAKTSNWSKIKSDNPSKAYTNLENLLFSKLWLDEGPKIHVNLKEILEPHFTWIFQVSKIFKNFQEYQVTFRYQLHKISSNRLEDISVWSEEFSLIPNILH